MSDLLLLTEKIRNTLFLGESHFREFKSALEGKPDHKKPRLVKSICADIGEALVSFANADGGSIIIGVEDNGTITGISHSAADIEIMLNAVNSHVYQNQKLPIVHAVSIELDGKNILYFSVNKGTNMIYQLPDGRCVIRKDKATIPASIHLIQFERQEVISREYDSLFVDSAEVLHLDTELLQLIADKYIKGLSIERYLQQIGLAEYGLNGLRLKKAALLLFAKNIGKWHPRCQIRFIKVNGSSLESGEKYNVITDDIIEDNIFNLVHKAWEHIRSFLAYKTEFGSNGQFVQKYIYPEDAIREAILNAIAHRDYNITNAIEIYFFTDRLEIKSPGALLSTINIENLNTLQGAHESRNSLIARVLKENNLMRELGEGMKRMFDLMNFQELTKPILYSNGLWFSITFSNKTIYNSKEIEWLKLFEKYNLNNYQKRIVVLCMGDKLISSNDILKACNTNNIEILTSEVSVLRKFGILKETMNSKEIFKYAKQNGISKRDVPKYKVELI